ncbi:MAG: alkaline phosphatase [Acidobacteria bacterium]|nr:alkaline phosphatase [Acidobacteriota bacterium]
MNPFTEVSLSHSRSVSSIVLVLALASAAFAQSSPSARLLLPERTRLLQGQMVDLVLEVRNAASVSGLRVTAGGVDLTSKFSAPAKAELDCDATSDYVLRADLQSFNTPGTVKLEVSLTTDQGTVSDARDITVYEFSIPSGRRRNVVLFVGDAMGTAYRDAARLVSRAIVDDSGKSSFRDGFFDNLLEMDKMPVAGMAITHGTDSIVPDSANTGASWASGNKTFLNAINVFTDGTDCKWRFNGQQNAANLPFMMDNPRVENLWQYLKRRFGYRTGIVSTAAVTDATPAVQGSYVSFRQMRLEVAKQFVSNPMLGGRPAFDVILGGGADPFLPGGRTDGRNLVGELQSMGYRYVTTASELKGVNFGQPTIGLFKSGTPRPASNGIATATDANMDVAYDKLKMQRPASEPVANLGAFTDQPMLDLMTEKAIDVLSSSFAQVPFILMVEAASIDKQSHPNQAAGTIWDTIEFDKAIGVARAWAAKRPAKDTLVVVTADHDQSMSIIGVSNTADTEYFDRNKSEKISFKTGRGDQDFTVWGDSYSNARAGLPFINSSTGASNNGGSTAMPGTHAARGSATDPASSTYSTYFGNPAYRLDAATGYPMNSGPGIRRLAVGFRTGDHTGSSVPVTAEGPGALLFTGYMDQTEIMFKMAFAISSDTAEMDKMVDFLQSAKFPKTPGK